MVRRKNAMHVPIKTEKKNTEEIIVIEGPCDSHKTTLAQITQDASIRLNFFSRVGSLFIAKQLKFYNGSEVYIREDPLDSQETLPIYHHGDLDTNCTLYNDLYYGIRYIRNTNLPNFHDTPKIREVIVIR